MKRKVICPHCSLSNDFNNSSELHCWACAKDFTVDEHDFQNVKFMESNDGYHCWQSMPKEYHSIYVCLNYPKKCGRCIRNQETFCNNGKIDIRMKKTAVIGKI